MRSLLLIVVAVLLLASPCLPKAEAQSQPAPSSATRLGDADLEELLAPIALYPDPLLASVLAASIYPQEVREAANAVKGGADAARIDAASWEEPVKAVAKVPEVVKFLSDNFDWTTALGEAYVVQGPDVMKAVQNLRARAYANGALQTTPQQTVTTQGDTIIIQPAQPEVIYVPTYNPSVVYVDDSSDAVVAGLIGFGVGVAFGAALNCDWHYGGVCWGGGWGWHGGYADVDIDRNVNIGDVNIGSGNTNIDRTNVGNRVGGGTRPGAEGSAWQPNRDKMSSSLRNGQTRELSSFKGAGSQPNVASRVPGMGSSPRPIASTPAPRPSTVNRPSGGAAPARPAATPAQRPSKASPATGGDGRAAGGASRPDAPKPSAAPGAGRGNVPKPSTPAPKMGGGSGGSRASAYSGGGGNRSAAASRGASSRGSSSAVRSGGGGRGGGGRGGGGRGR